MLIYTQAAVEFAPESFVLFPNRACSVFETNEYYDDF